jgi:diguanylate cyclase (GGDEF)-like protein
VSLLLIKRDGELVSVRIDGHEFACEEEYGETMIPKRFLVGFHLSEIPDGIVIKPVDAIEGNVVQVEHDVALSRFCEGSASAFVEEMFRRKFWDGDVGLTPYVVALRQAVAEQQQASETDFQDDGDYIFLHYEITIASGQEVQDAIKMVEGTIEQIGKRADLLVARRRDGLLGIFDRGSFDADLAHAINTPAKDIALVMADIDHFKAVNDQHGHQAGDAVLKAVAQVLLELSSGGVVPYRYGGEELGVVMLSSTREEAIRFAEVIRTRVANLSFPYNPELRVTISLGVAAARSDRTDKDDLVRRADAALYSAKRLGRNRVESSH